MWIHKWFSQADQQIYWQKLNGERLWSSIFGQKGRHAIKIVGLKDQCSACKEYPNFDRIQYTRKPDPPYSPVFKLMNTI